MDKELLLFLSFLVNRAFTNMEKGDGRALRHNLNNLRNTIDEELKKYENTHTD